jgi:hypothetical protein
VNDLSTPKNETQENLQNAEIVFINNTQLIVKIVRGTGTVNEGIIYPGKSLSVSYMHNSGTVFYPRFYLPLIKNFIYPPLDERGLDPSERVFYRVDGSQKEQKIEINNPNSIIDDSTFIVFTNDSNRGGLTLESPSGVFHCLFPNSDKRIINGQETVIYSINPRNSNLFISPVNKQLEKIQYHNSYVYYFTFDGSSITLTDSRPLHRVGENSWVEPKEEIKNRYQEIVNATSVMPLITDNNEIHLFASNENELNRIVFDSVGNKKNTIPSRDSYKITYASVINDGFFIAGYKEIRHNNYKPYAQIIGMDGVLKRQPQESADFESVRYLTAARKDNTTWLLAGDCTNPLLTNNDGTKTSHFGSIAYARIIRDEGNKLNAIKDWDGKDFLKYNNIKAAEYNKEMACWLITGEKISPSNGYYLARINDDGTIQNISDFTGIEFNKIFADKNGCYYLAGQEQKGDGTYAVLIKYDTSSNEIWRSSKQPQSHSYYYTGILDNENNRIILAGTLKANDKYGNGGKPFIESVDITNGSLDWHEEFIEPDFSETSLVTALEYAPYYGFVLTLSSMNDGYISKPYKIARINSRGKYITYYGG